MLIRLKTNIVLESAIFNLYLHIYIYLPYIYPIFLYFTCISPIFHRYFTMKEIRYDFAFQDHIAFSRDYFTNAVVCGQDRLEDQFPQAMRRRRRMMAEFRKAMENMGWDIRYLIGGFKPWTFMFHFIYWGCHPYHPSQSDELHHFSRWLKPPTSN